MPPAGQRIGLGQTAVVVTATDPCGNTADCTVTITVSDQTPPELTCPPDAVVECGQSIDPDALGRPAVTDNADPEPTLSYNDDTTLGDCPQAFVISRVWTALDAAGNDADCTQTITVRDTAAPVFACPQPVALAADAQGGATVPDLVTGLAVTDACCAPDAVAVAQTPPPSPTVRLEGDSSGAPDHSLAAEKPLPVLRATVKVQLLPIVIQSGKPSPLISTNVCSTSDLLSGIASPPPNS